MKHEINLYGEITDWGCFDEDIVNLDFLNKKINEIKPQKGDDIYFNINTLGGSTDVAFAIYNKIRRIANEDSINIVTRVDGYCASSGVILLLAGDKRIGNRFAEPFVHNAWTYADGNADRMQKVQEDLTRVDDMIATLYSERTTISKEEALNYMNNDSYISSEKCLELGFYTELENTNEQITDIENRQKTLIFNSIKNKRVKINNNNNKKNEMNLEEQKSMFQSILTSINNLGKMFTKHKNVMLLDATGKEINFPSVEEGLNPQVGDAGEIDGQPVPDGTYEMPSLNNASVTFVGGVITEIVEVDTEMENLKKENEALKQQNLELTSKVTETENKILEIENEFKNLKTQITGKFKFEFNKKEEQITGVEISDRKRKILNKLKK